MTNIKNTHNNAGFTLVELLVVMGIIGVLAGVLFTNFSGARERARDTKRKNDLTQMKSALRLFYNDNQSYPATNADNEIVGCGTSPSFTACVWGDPFISGATVYMNQLPQDPAYDADVSGSPMYTYSMGTVSDSSNTDSFVLRAELENSSDSSITESQRKCGVALNAIADNVFMVCAD